MCEQMFEKIDLLVNNHFGNLEPTAVPKNNLKLPIKTIEDLENFNT